MYILGIFNIHLMKVKQDIRRDAFESLDYIHKDDEGFLYIDKRLLDIEKKQIEEYALKKLNEK